LFHDRSAHDQLLGPADRSREPLNKNYLQNTGNDHIKVSSPCGSSKKDKKHSLNKLRRRIESITINVPMKTAALERPNALTERQ